MDSPRRPKPARKHGLKQNSQAIFVPHGDPSLAFPSKTTLSPTSSTPNCINPFPPSRSSTRESKLSTWGRTSSSSAGTSAPFEGDVGIDARG